MNNDRRRYLTPGEVAKYLMVSTMTIRRWAALGLLPARTTSGGHRRFLKRDVERFAQERRIGPSQRSSPGLRILVVDENESFARSLRRILSAKSEVGEVQLASSAFDAGRRLRDFRPDVVLMDWMMPGMNGFEVCRGIKADPITSDVRVFAIAGYPAAHDAKEVIAAGAAGYLSKPLNLNQLLPLLGIS